MSSIFSHSRMKHNANGSVDIRLSEGSVITLAGGDACVDLPSRTTVGVKHLAEVESHTVNTIAGSRSHVVRFVNGSVLQFAYNNAGDLIDLPTRNLAFALSDQGELLFFTGS